MSSSSSERTSATDAPVLASQQPEALASDPAAPCGEAASEGLNVPSMSHGVRRLLATSGAAAESKLIPLALREEQRQEIAKFLPAAREKYHLQHEIGRGGMGRVWAMRDADIGRMIAVKLLEDGLEAMPEEVGRFLQEAQITGQLEHPNIVPVYELGCTEAGQLYFTMKRVRGISLGEILFRLRHGDESIVAQYDVAALLRILLKVCDAVAYAHDRGVVHRDLKPDNIMVGRFGEVLVMDWGVAKVLPAESANSVGEAGEQESPVTVRKRTTTGKRQAEREITDRFEPPPPLHTTERPLTLKGTVIGTPAYMAPEQGRGNVDGEEHQPVSPQTDVYSLGAILYEVLTHEPPFAEDDPVLVVRRLLDGPPPSIKERVKGRYVPPELCAIASTAMAREPQHRYESAEAFAADLLAYLEGRPVSVHRDSAPRRLRKWVRRQPAMAVGAASVVLLLLVSTVLGGATLTSRLEVAEQQAQQERERQRQLEAQLEIERELLRRRELDELRRKIPRNVDGLSQYALARLVPTCTQLLNIEPDHVPTRIIRGIAYWRLDRLERAQRDFDRALRNEPDSERANHYRALVAERRGEIEQGLRFLDRAIAANPHDFARQVVYLRLLAARGEFTALQARIDELLERFPRRAGPLIKLRVRYFELVQRHDEPEPPSPEELPRLGLAGDGRPPESSLDRGYALLIKGEYDAAKQMLRTSDLEAHPIAVWYGLACCQARLGIDGALNTLYHAWDSGLAESPHEVLGHDPDLDRLRERPEFERLQRKRD